MILSDEYDRLAVENSETGEEIAVITRDGVTTADDRIVVRLKPSEEHRDGETRSMNAGIQDFYRKLAKRCSEGGCDECDKCAACEFCYTAPGSVTSDILNPVISWLGLPRSK